jgi:hypothetical protein
VLACPRLGKLMSIMLSDLSILAATAHNHACPTTGTRAFMIRSSSLQDSG